MKRRDDDLRAVALGGAARKKSVSAAKPGPASTREALLAALPRPLLLQAVYKRDTYRATLLRDGSVKVDGIRHASLSAASVDGLTTEKALSGDIGYEVRMPRVKGRATLYYVHTTDGIWSRSFYHDVYRTFVNYSMTGVAQKNVVTTTTRSLLPITRPPR